MNIKNIKWKGITLTNSAYKKMYHLIKKNKDVHSIQIKIKKSGCAGFKYYLSFLYSNHKIEIKKFYFYKIKNICIYILLKHMKFIDGTQIDFTNDNDINMSFKFNNPKIKEFCGCGESFNINDKKLKI